MFQVRLTCEYMRDQVKRFTFDNVSDVCRVPMLPEDVIESIHGGDLLWSDEDSKGDMVAFDGDERIFMENLSISETY